MKFKALILTAVVVLTMTCISMLPAAAHSSLLADSASVVSQEEYSKIDDALWEVHTAHDCMVTIKTTETFEGQSAASYADAWYANENQYSPDYDNGIALVVGIEEQEYFILTTGSCISAFTDVGLDYIEEQIVPDMSAGNYEDAFITFAHLCDDYLTQAETGKPYDVNNMPKEPFNFAMSLLIALVVGLVAGGIVVLILFLNLKSVHKQSGAADYQKQGSFHLETKRDIYLYRKVEREEKPDNDKDGGSTTFSGNSGKTRGGSGGSF